MTAPVVRLWPRAVARAETEAHDRNRHPAYRNRAHAPVQQPVRPAEGRWLAAVPSETSEGSQ